VKLKEFRSQLKKDVPAIIQVILTPYAPHPLRPSSLTHLTPSAPNYLRLGFTLLQLLLLLPPLLLLLLLALA